MHLTKLMSMRKIEITKGNWSIFPHIRQSYATVKNKTINHHIISRIIIKYLASNKIKQKWK